MELRTEDRDAVREESLQQPPFPPLTRNKSTIDSTILSPGAVKINFQGAFIVDDEEFPATSEDGPQHDSKDIRLPNHKAVVSHVALDASYSPYTVASTSLNTSRILIEAVNRLVARSRSSFTSRENAIRMGWEVD